ncbi:MAG: hypothetical protein AB2598_07030 [Candidatus Thiodiazotropha sp.]
MDYLISGGKGLIRRIHYIGVEVLTTSAEDPLTAVTAVVEGRPLSPTATAEQGRIRLPIVPPS